MDRLFLLLCFYFLISSCNLTNNQNHAVEAQGIALSFIDQQSNDLLNPDHSNAITEENTDLYYLINDEKEKYFKGNLDHPKGFFISDEKLSDRYFMSISPNIIKGQGAAITYIQFNDTSMDTIKVKYDIGSNVTTITKVWYNGEIRWNINGENNNEGNKEHVSIYFKVTRELQ